MAKRKTLLTVLFAALCACFVSGVTLFGGTFTVGAAEAALCVKVNGFDLYDCQYLESNDAAAKSSGAVTEPAGYVAWYKDGILRLNGYNGDEISAGGDLTIKLNDNNTVTSGQEGVFVSSCDNLIIDADSEATLNINVSSKENDVFGISVGRVSGGTGNVTIKGKSKVNIVCGTTNYMAFGIYSGYVTGVAGEASLDVKCVSQKVNAGEGDSYGIYSNRTPVFNTSGTIKIDTSECATASYCVYSAANVSDLQNGDCLFKYKKEASRSFASYPTMTNAPDGYVMRQSLNDGEDVLKKGAAHTVTVERGTDYYGKNTNQYVVGETVTIKTSIDGLTFLGWEGDGVGFAAATQKETTFTMLDKDVTVRATYDVFANKPVFERTGENTGSISVRLKGEASGHKSVILTKSTGEEIAGIEFLLNALSDDFTYKSSIVRVSSAPAGRYRIRARYNGSYYFYSEPFEIGYTDKTPDTFTVTVTNGTAEVGDSTISSAAKGSSVTITANVKEGYVFVKWVVVSGGAVLADANNSTTTFDMPESNVVIEATFRELAHVHSYKKVSGEDATCIKEGRKTYYECDGCKLRFKDEVGTEEITDESWLVIPKSHHEFGEWIEEVPATKEATGKLAHKDCEFCHKHFDKDGNEIEDLTIEKLHGVYLRWGTIQAGEETSTGSGRGYAMLDVAKGTEVTIIAPEQSDAVFVKWIAESGNITFANENSATTTFVMQNQDVWLKCEFKVIRSVTVKGGTLEGGETSGKFTEGETVRITAEATLGGKEFVKWLDLSGKVTFEKETDTTTTFVMPADNVEIIALYKSEHTLVLVKEEPATCTENGTKKHYLCKECGRKFTDEAETEEITDDSVLIIPMAHKFGEWIEEVPATKGATGKKAHKDCEFCHKHFDKDGNEIEDLTLYKTYTVYLRWGTIKVGEETSTGSGRGYAMLDVTEGTTVTIIAPEQSGAVFVKWIAESGNITFEDENSATTTFVMQDQDVWLKCEFKDAFAVTVENGNAGGTAFEAGQTVTVTANAAPEGKEFDKWVVVKGNVALANEKGETTTFVMPNESVEIKATYKDKTPGGDNPGADDPSGEIPPTEKEGLSGGAIAGIAIGSVAVAGCGGFAIFWFVIKKKSFAELIAAIKGLFKKN